MKEKHKKRILGTLNEIRNWNDFQGDMYNAMALIQSLKTQALLRIDNIILRAMINDISSEFDDRVEALMAINKLKPILDEVEDYLFDDDFEAILNVEVQLVPNKSHSQNEITLDNESKIKKTIKSAKQLIEDGKTEDCLSLLLRDLEGIIDDEQINNLRLLKSRISLVNDQFSLGLQNLSDISIQIAQITAATLKEIGRIHRTFFIR
jgi:hypothetical protein